jgi:hypothetical protein
MNDETSQGYDSEGDGGLVNNESAPIPFAPQGGSLIPVPVPVNAPGPHAPTDQIPGPGGITTNPAPVPMYASGNMPPAAPDFDLATAAAVCFVVYMAAKLLAGEDD